MAHTAVPRTVPRTVGRVSEAHPAQQHPAQQHPAQHHHPAQPFPSRPTAGTTADAPSAYPPYAHGHGHGHGRIGVDFAGVDWAGADWADVDVGRISAAHPANQQHPAHYRQRGAVLAVALIFLLLLSIVAIGLMRSGQLEVLMAGNAQARLGAYELAEAVAESALANWKDNLDTEAIVCTPGHPDPDCDTVKLLVWDDRLNPAEDSALPPVDKATVTARAKPLNQGQPACVPPFITGIAHGTWAFFFDVEATFDNTDERQGASRVNHGAVVVNPVSADCFSNPPQGNLDNFAHVPTS